MATKRRRVHSDNSVSAPSATSSSVPPLTALLFIALLKPTRDCFHPFLDGATAVQLMQLSRSATSNLLTGYRSVDQVLTFHPVAEVQHAVNIFSQHSMCILRLQTSERWTELLVDTQTGRPVLPTALLALAFHQRSERHTTACDHSSMCCIRRSPWQRRQCGGLRRGKCGRQRRRKLLPAAHPVDRYTEAERSIVGPPVLSLHVRFWTAEPAHPA